MRQGILSLSQQVGQALGQERLVPAVEGNVSRPADGQVDTHRFGPQLRRHAQGVIPESQGYPRLTRRPHPPADDLVDGVAHPGRAVS